MTPRRTRGRRRPRASAGAGEVQRLSGRHDGVVADEIAMRDSRIRILGSDPSGRGLAVVSFRDPLVARHVAVLVPGSDIDLQTLDDAREPSARPLGWARALADATDADTAVVLWVGYRTPRGLGYDAVSGRLARAGAPALIAEIRRLRERPGPAPHLTVIAHSYGSVLVGLAAPRLPVDDLVFLGSPGVRARTEAGLRTGARVWAARAPNDWMRFVPSLRVGDLGHGRDPVRRAFGARRLPADDAPGHDGYLRPRSATLAAVRAVVSGHPDR